MSVLDDLMRDPVAWARYQSRVQRINTRYLEVRRRVMLRRMRHVIANIDQFTLERSYQAFVVDRR